MKWFLVSVLAACSLAYAQEVSVTDVIGYQEGDNAKLIGIVENKGTEAVEFTQVIASLYDESGAFVDTGSTYTTLNVLLPGEVSPFELYVLGVSGFRTFDYQVQATVASSGAVRDISVDSLNVSLEGDNVSLSGQVTNQGSNTREFVQIVYRCFNDVGEVAGVGSTYSTLDTLASGQTSPFQGYVLSPPRAVATCNATAQGR